MHILPLSISKGVEKFFFKHYVKKVFNEQVSKGLFNKKEIPTMQRVHFTREPLTTSLLNEVPASLVPEAIQSFSDILTFMGIRKDAKFNKEREKEKDKDDDGNYLTSSVYGGLARDIINRAVCAQGLGDEVLVQLMRQLKRNSDKASRDRCWELLYVYLFYFSPSKLLERFFVKFLHDEINYVLFLPNRDMDDDAPDAVGTGTGLVGVGLGGAGPPLASGVWQPSEFRDDDSVLFAQLCLNVLHSSVLFTGINSAQRARILSQLKSDGSAANPASPAPTSSAPPSAPPSASASASASALSASSAALSAASPAPAAAESPSAVASPAASPVASPSSSSFSSSSSSSSLTSLASSTSLSSSFSASSSSATTTSSFLINLVAAAAFGYMVANERVLRKLAGTRDRGRQFHTHLQHIVFHQVNKYRYLLSQALQIPVVADRARYALSCLYFHLPLPVTPPTSASEANPNIPPPSPLTGLHWHYLPKLAVYLAMRVLSYDGITTEGIFRKSVNQTLLKEYMNIIDCGIDAKERWNTVLLVDDGTPLPPGAGAAAACIASNAAPVNTRFLQVINEDCKDPQMFASLFKLWLREFEEPIIPFDKYDAVIKFIGPHWTQSGGNLGRSTPLLLDAKTKDVSESDTEVNAREVTNFFNKTLPPLNVSLLKYLVRFLRLFMRPEFNEQNKMTEENLAIVMGPNLIHREVPNPKEDPKIVIMREQPLLRVLLRDLRVTEEEDALFDSAERDIAAEYGIDVGDFYRGVLAEREKVQRQLQGKGKS